MNISDIQTRLTRLETANRRLKFTLGALAAIVAAGLLIAANNAAGPVSATSFQLVDSNGKLRGEFGADKDGTFFFLNDDSGAMRMSIAAQKTGSFVSFKDAKGKSRASLAFDEEGAGLRLKDANGQLHGLFLADEKGPVFQMIDNNGKRRTIDTMVDVLEEPKPAK